jgi:hypothetical protein
MTRVCAWCRTEMGTVEGSKQPDDVTSHGICKRCVDNLIFQQGAPLQAYLDSIPVPVMAVDRNVVVGSVNAKGCEVLGKEAKEIVQHLGGDVFECAHARLPEGCGRTMHCSGCVIRRSVTYTYETGNALTMVPATLSLSRKNSLSPVQLTITTVKAGSMVILRVDRMSDC